MPGVRNLRSIGGIKPIPVIHFIPPAFKLIYKLELVSSTETIDVTKSLVEGSFVYGVTSTIGNFNFRLLDPTNNYSGRIEEFDTIKLYLDYGATATSLRFAGKIERKINSENLYLNLSGNSMAIITMGTNVTYNSGGLQARSVILKAIIDKYFLGTISTSSVEDDLGEIEVDYSEIPFWEVVEKLCDSGGRDAFISPDSIMNYFLKGSRQNITEAIIENRNLIEPIEFAKDTEEVITKVRVYGQRIDNIPIIATSDSNTSVTKGIDKILKIDNSNISSVTQAKAVADWEYEAKRVLPTLGAIKSLMIPTIAPGEQLKIVSPTNNIPPLFYNIQSYIHNFSREGVPTTIVTIEKPRLNIPRILKKRIKFESEIVLNVNPNELDFSYIEDFNTSNGTLTNTIFRSGILQTDGSSSGTWNSGAILLKVIPTETTLTISNIVNPKNITVRMSFDGGITFSTAISNGIGQTINTTATTKSIVVEITLNAATASIGTMGILYK